MEGRSLPKPKKVEVSKANDLLAALRSSVGMLKKHRGLTKTHRRQCQRWHRSAARRARGGCEGRLLQGCSAAQSELGGRSWRVPTGKATSSFRS